MTHNDLCERALRWLSGTRKCEPVFHQIASCAEIPDAIGWSSCFRFSGSTVLECKVSRADFYADLRKQFAWRHPDWNERHFEYRASRISAKEATANGYIKRQLPRMGDYRFYLSQPGIVTAELVEKHAPDHGLLHIEGARVRVIRDAPRRENANYPAEIRYLRFAIINGKQVFGPRDEREGLEG